MKKTGSKKAWVLHWILRLVLGLTFVGASWHKILDPGDFAKIIYGYGLFPDISINALAIVRPHVEFLAGICLILGILPRSCLMILNGLLVAFILVIGFNLWRGHVFDCGCFSFGNSTSVLSAGWILARDIVLLGTGIFLWRSFKPAPRKRSISF